MTATTRFAGRREDARFITGQGRYTSDWSAPGELHAAFRRSDRAHARLASVDASAARAAPGVIAVYTAADFPPGTFRTIQSVMPFEGRDGMKLRIPERPFLARDKVRFVGEEIAVVLAESRHAALDAAELVDVQYEELPAVIGWDAPLASGAPALHDSVPGNLCFDVEYGDAAAAAAALARAAHRVSASVDSPRVAGAPMEPRAVLAWHDAGRDSYEIRCSNQGGEMMAMQLATMLGVERARIRVHMVDVGGGFGPRGSAYPEYAILLAAARRLGRPVKWLSTRSEDFLCDAHGRGIRVAGELGLDADGRFLAFRTEWICDQGAYLTNAGPMTNTMNGRLMNAGPYRVEAFHGRHRLVVTNAVPGNAYRGASRPEAALIVERLVDEAARVLGIDPIELRRRNALPPAAFPYTTPTGSVFDSADFPRLLDTARRAARWDEFPARRAAAQAAGRIRGIGCALFIEPSGGGFLPQDEVALRFAADGTVVAHVASSSQGQGHETVFPKLVATQLGIDPARVALRSSDPDGPPIKGNGAIGSRTTLAQGSALTVAAREAADKGRAIAAKLLEAAEADIAFEMGRYIVPGTDLAVSMDDVIRAGTTRADAPHPLDTLVAQPVPRAFPSGAHVAEVEIDPESGTTTLASFVAVDDIGNVIEPVLADGQIMGGVAQAAGQVFGEACHYDPASGQLVTASFQDYTMPRADTLPDYVLESVVTPSPGNALGAKGAGESGTTGALGALVNAVKDALRSAGVHEFEMPATPFRVWEALQRRG